MKTMKKLIIMTVLSGVSGLCAAQSAQVLTVCTGSSYSIPSATPASGAATYQWLENGVVIPGATAISYTNTSGKLVAGKYEYVRQAKTPNCGSEWMSSNVITVYVNAYAPGSTENFVGFVPCATAGVGTVWYLTDSREPNNIQTYKVKKMSDNRIWMVQDIKFGDKCMYNNFSSTSVVVQGKVSTVFNLHYGNCTALTNASTPSNRGYMYDWSATINHADACMNCTIDDLCGSSGCQGLCPVGWHVPTRTEFENIAAILPGENPTQWGPLTEWEGTYGGWTEQNGTLNDQGVQIHLSSSTNNSLSRTWGISNWVGDYIDVIYYGRRKDCGIQTRCIKN
jgi:uncharacterized protein (TIGR02145 family)